jgi:hypothetical protein
MEPDGYQMLTTKAIEQVIDFKWQQFGRDHHRLGFFMQIFYIFVFMQYIQNVYVKDA